MRARGLCWGHISEGQGNIPTEGRTGREHSSGAQGDAAGTRQSMAELFHGGQRDPGDTHPLRGQGDTVGRQDPRPSPPGKGTGGCLRAPPAPTPPHIASPLSRWGHIKADGPRAQPSVPREVPAMPRAVPAPAPPPPARPGQAFTIAALLGRSSPPPPAPPPPPPPPPFWGPWGSLPDPGPAAQLLPPPPLCIACRGVPPAWATRLGDTGTAAPRTALPGDTSGGDTAQGHLFQGYPQLPALWRCLQAMLCQISTGTPLRRRPLLGRGTMSTSPMRVSPNGDLFPSL